MQVIEVREGEIILVGDQPIGILQAAGKYARLATPNLPEETEADLQVFVDRHRRRAEKLDNPGHGGPKSGS